MTFLMSARYMCTRESDRPRPPAKQPKSGSTGSSSGVRAVAARPAAPAAETLRPARYRATSARSRPSIVHGPYMPS